MADSVIIGGMTTLRADFGGSDPTTVLLTLRDPEGVLTTFDQGELGNPEVGVYTHDLVCSKAGTWTFRFEATGGIFDAAEGSVRVATSRVLAGVPTYTYDPTTDIGRIRLLIDDRDLSDVDEASPVGDRSAIFSDQEIQAFIDLPGAKGSILRAAAEACRTIAGNRNLLLQTRKVGDQSASFGSIRSDYLALAKDLRAQADIDEAVTAPAYGTAEVAWGDFTTREILTNELLRQGM